MSRRKFLIAGAAAAASWGQVLNSRDTWALLGRGKAERPNIVVYLADSLRADHVGCYGYGLPTTPNIDELARDSVLFERCYSQCCWTKPSVASMFTGLLPQVHQGGLSEWNVEYLDDVPVQMLRIQFTTLAQSLKSEGYHTAYFLGNAHVQSKFGFGRGFEHYEYRNAWPPDDQIQAAVAWLRQQAHEPFFLFIHDIDPHAPYTPWSGHYQRLFGQGMAAAREELSEEELSDLECVENPPPIQKGEQRRLGEVPVPELSPRARRFLIHRYDAEVRRVDEMFGRLMGYLRDKELDDRTAVIVTSDHGESFGENGYYFHANGLHHAELRVPLIVRLPKSLRRRERVPWTVSQFDLQPTLVTLGGGAVPEGVQARPLLEPGGRVAVGEHRECYAAFGQTWLELDRWDESMVRGPWKVIRSEEGNRVAVYNVEEDPLERNDLAAPGAASRAFMRRLTDRFRETRNRHLELAAACGEPQWTSGGAGYADELESLGYL